MFHMEHATSFNMLKHNGLRTTYLDLTIRYVYLYDGVSADMSIEDSLCKKIYEFLLHQAFDRAGSVLWLVAFGTHIVFKFTGEFDIYTILA